MFSEFSPYLTRPRVVPALAAALSAGILAVALASQYWGGLQPCVLCYYQRYAYGAVMGFGLLGLILGGRRAWNALLTALCGLAFLTGAGIAFFHVGVEQRWWRGTDACHAPEVDFSASVEDQMAELLGQPFVACDQIPWSLFGVSMAGYNVLTSLALAGLCMVAVKAMAREGGNSR